jgi:acyl carrier protein
MIQAESNESFQREWGFVSTAPGHMLGMLESARPGYQAILDLNWDRFFSMAPQMRQFRPLKDFDKSRRLVDKKPEIRHHSPHLEDLLRNILAEILQDVPERIDFKKPFEEIGFNSLLAIELSNKLNTATGLSLPSTIIYAYPTPLQLLQFLKSEYKHEAEEVVQTADPGYEEDDFLRLQKMLDEKLKSGKP